MMWKWIKRALLLLLFATIIWFLLSKPSSPEQKRSTQGPVLRIVAANIYAGNRQTKWLADRMGVWDADLIVLIEATHNNIDIKQLEKSRRRNSIDRHRRQLKIKDLPLSDDPNPPKPYNKSLLRSGVDGIAVLSRQNLQASAALVAPPTQGNCHWPVATIRFTWRGQWYSALGVHAPPPVGGCERNEAYLAAIAKWISQGKFNRDVGTARAGDTAMILGDLNTMPMAGNIDPLLDAGLQDAYDEASLRPGPTWGFNFGPDFARIDYVLVAATEKVWNAWTLDLPGSDHRAVMVDIMTSDMNYVEPEQEPDHRTQHDHH